MSVSELKESARESLEVLHEIAEKIEAALGEADDYWTWAGFFSDKKDELMPVKDRGQEAVSNLQESVEELRERIDGTAHESLFEEIDERKDRIKDVVDEIRDTATLKTVAMNGDELAELMDVLLDRFRETSEAVERLLDSLEES